MFLFLVHHTICSVNVKLGQSCGSPGNPPSVAGCSLPSNGLSRLDNSKSGLDISCDVIHEVVIILCFSTGGSFSTSYRTDQGTKWSRPVLFSPGYRIAYDFRDNHHPRDFTPGDGHVIMFSSQADGRNRKYANFSYLILKSESTVRRFTCTFV
jgi:hypothetical protein